MQFTHIDEISIEWLSVQRTVTASLAVFVLKMTYDIKCLSTSTSKST